VEDEYEEDVDLDMYDEDDEIQMDFVDDDYLDDAIDQVNAADDRASSDDEWLWM